MWGIFDKKEPEQPKKGLEIVETDRPYSICFNDFEEGYIHRDEEGVYRAVFHDTKTRWSSNDLRDIQMYLYHLNYELEGETNE